MRTLVPDFARIFGRATCGTHYGHASSAGIVLSPFVVTRRPGIVPPATTAYDEICGFIEENGELRFAENACNRLLNIFSAVLYQLSYLATGNFLARSGLISIAHAKECQGCGSACPTTRSAVTLSPGQVGTRSTQHFSELLDPTQVRNTPKTPAQPVLNGFSS